MIDVHCHILPEVDDGSKSIEESIEMAKIAQSDGIKKIINTSHYNPNFEYIKGNVLINHVEEFKNILKDNNINLEIVLGNELYYTPDLLEQLNELDFYTLGNSNYILIEFPPMNVPKNLVDIVYEIKLKGFIPVLAHVERYEVVQSDPNIIYDCIEEGAIIQVNASSIIGNNGNELNKICDILLKNNMVHLVGSDAHGSKRRRPLLKESYEYVKSNYGIDYANDLFEYNANKILENKKLNLAKPTRFIQKGGFLSKLFRK